MSKFSNMTVYGFRGKYRNNPTLLPEWGGLRWGDMEFSE